MSSIKLYFFATSCSLWDLRNLTGDWTCVLGSQSVESSPNSDPVVIFFKTALMFRDTHWNICRWNISHLLQNNPVGHGRGQGWGDGWQYRWNKFDQSWQLLKVGSDYKGAQCTSLFCVRFKGQTESKWNTVPLGNTYSKMNIINYYLSNHFKILLRVVSTAIHCKLLIKQNIPGFYRWLIP